METSQTLFGCKSPAFRLANIQIERRTLKIRYQHAPQFRQTWKEIDVLLAGREADALKEMRRGHG